MVIVVEVYYFFVYGAVSYECFHVMYKLGIGLIIHVKLSQCCVYKISKTKLFGISRAYSIRKITVLKLCRASY